jgi:hypothetical protein
MNADMLAGSEILRSKTDESIGPKELSLQPSNLTGSKMAASEE